MWSAIATTDVLQEFTPAEAAALNAIQNATSNLAGVLTRTVAEARGSIRAGGYALDADGTIPDQLRSHVIALARWRWLISFPQLKPLQTEFRKAAAEEATKKLDQTANQKLNVEPPAGASSSPASMWNSENKIVPRAHPVPKPATQFQSPGNDYANPNAPADGSQI
jgi:hypothetical protein